MRRNKGRILATITAVAVLGLAGTALAGPGTPDHLRLAAPKTIKASKTPVEFPHARHAKTIKCAACHHTWSGNGEIKGCSSGGCHDQPGKKGPLAYYSTFHDKKNSRSCLGCHKAVNKRDGKHAPVSCRQCHPK